VLLSDRHRKLTVGKRRSRRRGGGGGELLLLLLTGVQGYVMAENVL